MALKVVLKDTYKKINQANNRLETRFMWTVTGAPKDVERFIEEQGENSRVDENGRPLFFNKQYPGTRNADLVRATLPDGTVIYKISMLEKTLAIEGLKMGELAKLEAEAEFYANGTATPAGPQRPAITNPAGGAATGANDSEETADVIAGTGNEALGDAV